MNYIFGHCRQEYGRFTRGQVQRMVARKFAGAAVCLLLFYEGSVDALDPAQQSLTLTFPVLFFTCDTGLITEYENFRICRNQGAICKTAKNCCGKLTCRRSRGRKRCMPSKKKQQYKGTKGRRCKKVNAGCANSSQCCGSLKCQKKRGRKACRQ